MMAGAGCERASGGLRHARRACRGERREPSGSLPDGPDGGKRTAARRRRRQSRAEHVPPAPPPSRLDRLAVVHGDVGRRRSPPRRAVTVIFTPRKGTSVLLSDSVSAAGTKQPATRWCPSFKDGFQNWSVHGSRRRSGPRARPAGSVTRPGGPVVVHGHLLRRLQAGVEGRVGEVDPRRRRQTLVHAEVLLRQRLVPAAGRRPGLASTTCEHALPRVHAHPVVRELVGVVPDQHAGHRLVRLDLVVAHPVRPRRTCPRPSPTGARHSSM